MGGVGLLPSCLPLLALRSTFGGRFLGFLLGSYFTRHLADLLRIRYDEDCELTDYTTTTEQVFIQISALDLTCGCDYYRFESGKGFKEFLDKGGANRLIRGSQPGMLLRFISLNS